MFAGQKTIENLLNKNESETENTIDGWSEEDEDAMSEVASDISAVRDELEDTESQNRELAADEIELLRQCRQLKIYPKKE